MLIQNFITELVSSLFSTKKKTDGKKWLSKFGYYAILTVIAIVTMTICVTVQVLICDALNKDLSDIGMAIGAGITIGLTSLASKRLKGCVKNIEE